MSKIHNYKGKAPEGNILVINTGSITTKFAFYADGEPVVEENIAHSAEELARYTEMPEQALMRKKAMTDILAKRGIPLENIDIVMARGGLFTPCITGIYNVNADMREVLFSNRDGRHPCNLSAIIGDDLAREVNDLRDRKGVTAPFGPCVAYVADPPMADEMLPECHPTGLPEFKRTTLFHALNSRAILRRYLRETGRSQHTTAIVCHMGGGITVSLHRDGRVIDTTHGVGGDGPITPERAGNCPPNQLVDLCFSGKYTKEEIMKRLVGRGGAVAYFGTNDMRTIIEKAKAGIPEYDLFLKAFILSIAKYIYSLTAVVNGEVDVIILTGGIAFSRDITDAITEKVRRLAPVEVYPGEKELESLAENGYIILSGQTKIHTYDKNRIIED